MKLKLELEGVIGMSLHCDLPADEPRATHVDKIRRMLQTAINTLGLEELEVGYVRQEAGDDEAN